jgi:hypothetical protein
MNQLSPEELETLRNLQKTYSEITAKFGQVKVEKILLTNQLNNLSVLEQSFEADYLDTQSKETEFLKTLESKYGKVTVNLDSGEITT